MATRGVQGREFIIKGGLKGKIPNFMNSMSGTNRHLHEAISHRKCQNTMLNSDDSGKGLQQAVTTSQLLHQQHQSTVTTAPVSIQTCSPPGTLGLQPDLLTWELVCRDYLPRGPLGLCTPWLLLQIAVAPGAQVWLLSLANGLQTSTGSGRPESVSLFPEVWVTFITGV